MQLWEIIFLGCLGVLVYNYMGYGALLALVAVVKKKPAVQPLSTSVPAVTMVIPAFNEATVIEQKLANCLALDYPAHLLRFLFVTDGSTDGTPLLLASGNDRIAILHGQVRLGKTAALNKAMQQVTTPIVVFSDANSLLDKAAIRNIVASYTRPAIGAVTGAKHIRPGVGRGLPEQGETSYWRYEGALKKWESVFYTVIGGVGELFSLRTSLYQPLPEEVISDDFVLSYRVHQQGYQIAYASKAVAWEMPSPSLAAEWKRKVRIAAGSYQSLHYTKGYFNLLRQPLLTFQYLSHHWLRWMVSPWTFPLLLWSNAMLLKGHWIFRLSLLMQLIFYTLALVGALTRKRIRQFKLLPLPFYFVFMQAALYVGFYKWLLRKQSVLWEKSQRAAFSS